MSSSTHFTSVRDCATPIEFYDLGVMHYEDAWAKQQEIVELRHKNLHNDAVFFVEHESIYTAGKRTEHQDRPTQSDIPVIDVDRGGKITWHGPGQLVAYPIIKLSFPLDVIRYVRRLELAIMATCARFGVTTCQIPERSGVWIRSTVPHCPAKKIGAIGIRISHGITHHGLALNCNNVLAPYQDIIPCGLPDASTTTLSQETHQEISPEAVQPILKSYLAATLDGDASLYQQFPHYTDK